MENLLINCTGTKRVACLYRVSTIGQVEKDDIPMQKQCCHEFCQRQPGWKIVKEFSEKGISGFKVSAKDRDAIQELQKAAVQGEIDILLVFMFDRLGRRDDETPFIVEWFVKNGVEVWSAMEGQQRFDNHVDKLLNYIRYWQASGESIKTSVRTKTRIGQLTEEGHFTGGGVPFGYQLVHNGRVNKKNRPVYDLAIEPQESEIVKLIFQKYVNEGYGSQRLCRYLSDEGILNRNGKNIPTTSINRIIKNPIYTGFICNGDSKSEHIPELQIINQETFDRAREIMTKRVTHHAEVPLNTAGKSLLVGNVYCGHCGGKLTLTTSGRNYTRKDGTIYKRTYYRYTCTYNTRHPGECGGQSGYGMVKLDNLVDQIVRIQFNRIKNAPPKALLEEQQNREVAQIKAKLKRLTEQYEKKQKEYQDLQDETIKVIQGTSRLNIDLLNSVVEQTQERISELRSSIAATQHELETASISSTQVKAEYNKLLDWANLYDSCTFEAKKMIISQFIKTVYVKKDYELDIVFNVSFEQFQSLYLNPETENHDRPGTDAVLAYQ